STEQLTSVLTPFRGNLVGSYRQFVYEHPFRTLPREGVLEAIRWARSFGGDGQVPFELRPLVDEAVRRAWAQRSSPEIAQELAHLILERARHYIPLILDRDDEEFVQQMRTEQLA